MSKICTKCKILKDEKEYAKGHSSWCKSCQRIVNSEKYKQDPQYFLTRAKRYKLNNIEKYIFSVIKKRAKDKNLEFDLEISDIVVPEYCPVLGLKLEFSNGLKNRNSSPSVDRKNNNKGYTKDNIEIISFRANALKNNASIKELEKVLEYMRKNK